MAHKTLVGGTAYEIKGGKDLIGGTVYEKDHGKTLVGSTVYEVGFAPDGATVTIGVASGYEKDVLLIDGVYYGKEATTLTLPIGTVIAISSGVNQVVLHKQGDYVGNIGYEYTVMGDITIYITGTKPVPTFTVYVVNINEL